MTILARAIVLVATAVALDGCDNRQAFHRPDPSLARMLEQRRADPYAPSAVFADGKTMRDPPRGTVARDDDDDPSAQPPAITRALLIEGRRHFEVVCAACHGITGEGVSVVATKMRQRPPPSLLDPRYRELPRERLFAIVTGGYGMMPSYADMLRAPERWAVVSYVKALQLSQYATVAELPSDVRADLAKEAP
jgi:mono/diheme cytochrome c family protein